MRRQRSMRKDTVTADLQDVLIHVLKGVAMYAAKAGNWALSIR